MRQQCPDTSAFWEWVKGLEVTDDPRGDFIADTQRTSDPDLMMAGACREAREEYDKLRAEWDRPF